MVLLGDISVWIEVDGDSLPEYDLVIAQNGKDVTCWIPSEAGKNFKIYYKNTGRHYTSGISCTVDGVPVGGRFLRSRSDRPNYPDQTCVTGIDTEEGVQRPFIFSNCQLTDDDSILTRTLGLGEIGVKVSSIEINKLVPPSGSYSKPLAPLKIHERSKKGIVHGVQLGEPAPFRSANTYHVKYIEIMADITFRYRPLGLLQADGIAPPKTPQPRHAPPKSENSDILDLTLESNNLLDQMVEKIRALEEEIHELKGTKRKREPVEVKIEREVKRERRSGGFPNEVIDLT